MIKFGILAAGDGSRLFKDGVPLPKPLITINGQPMIGRLVNLMRDCGAESISVIANDSMPSVITYIEELSVGTTYEFNILTANTESSLHSLNELVKVMQPDDKFIVSTVDSIFRPIEFSRFVDTFKEQPKEVNALMGVTYHIDDENPLYVTVNKDHVIEDYPETAQNYVSAGVYGLTVSTLPVLEKCIQTGVKKMRNFQRTLIKEGLLVKAFDFGKVIDVDHLSDIEQANLLLD